MGNYWSDHTGPDEDEDGIVDTPCEIAGSAGSEDKYLLVSPVIAGPTIRSIDIEPDQPGPGEPVTVRAVITDPDGVARADLWYRNDTEWYIVRMAYVGNDTYEATIPGQKAGTTVSFKIYARDEAGNWAVSSTFTYTVKARAPGPGAQPPVRMPTIWIASGVAVAVRVAAIVTYLLKLRR